MLFQDERTQAHFGYWYQGVADSFFRQRTSEVDVHLHDPDLELEALHHKLLLFIADAQDGFNVVLYPKRIEGATKTDTERYDLTIACLTKATNDLTWRPKTHK